MDRTLAPTARYALNVAHVCSISFGVVSFEVATRTEPFKGMNPTQVIMAVALNKKRPEIPEWASASPDVVPLMEQCWKQDPADRPEGFNPVVQALASAVSRVGDPRTQRAAPADPTPPSGAKREGGASVDVSTAPLSVGGSVDASPLESMPIKELLATAVRLGISTAGTVEKRVIVERIKCGMYSAEGAKDLRNKADRLRKQVTVEIISVFSVWACDLHTSYGEVNWRRLSCEKADHLYLRAIKKFGRQRWTLIIYSPEVLSNSSPHEYFMCVRPVALLFQGKYAEAAPLYLRVTEIQENMRGPDHQDVATTLNNWAELLRAQVRADFVSRRPLV